MSNFDFKDVLCPVCNSKVFDFYGFRGGIAHQSGAGEKTAIVRCNDCSHLYPNPMPFPKGDLNEIYINADEYFHGHNVEVKKQNGLRMMKKFEERIGKKGRFLDVGCGVGEIMWAAKECGWDAHGIDPSAEFIRIGRERLGVEGIVSTLEDARYPSNHFDIIVMSGIIEHLYTPFETLNEVHRVLKPDGWFWFDAPNEDGLYMKCGNLYMQLRGRDWVVNLAPTFPPYHVQGFTPKSLKKILDRTNFILNELEVIGGITKQTGKQTLRKKIEYNGAKLINLVGITTGNGMYMKCWAHKK